MPRKTAEGLTQFKFRLADDLKRSLEASATERGTSLNAEITERLARSVRDKRYWENVSDPKIVAIAELVTQAMFVAGQNSGTFSAMSAAGGAIWYDDPYAFEQVCRAINVVLERLRPPGKMKLPSPQGHSNPSLFENIGKIVAEGILSEASNSAGLPLERAERAEKIGKGLGEDLLERIAEKTRAGK
jgi:hypothetical protein